MRFAGEGCDGMLQISYCMLRGGIFLRNLNVISVECCHSAIYWEKCNVSIGKMYVL